MTELQAAEARAAAARERLQSTTTALQAKLDPRSMARDAVDGITDTGERALRTGAEVARNNPGKIAGAIAILGALLARHRIADAVRRRRGKH